MSKDISEELLTALKEDQRFIDAVERCVVCDHLKAHHAEDGKCLFGASKYSTIVGKIE